MMRIVGPVGIAVLLAACGGKGTQVLPTQPPPTVAGAYSRYDMWLVQYVRPHDNYQGAFYCSGSLTFVQPPGSATLTGFAVVGSPCPSISFELSGTVAPGGTIEFTSGGPRPGAGPCPAPTSVKYAGTLTEDRVSVRGSTTVDCPGAGEGLYRFDIIVNGSKAGY